MDVKGPIGWYTVTIADGGVILYEFQSDIIMQSKNAVNRSLDYTGDKTYILKSSEKTDEVINQFRKSKQHKITEHLMNQTDYRGDVPIFHAIRNYLSSFTNMDPFKIRIKFDGNLNKYFKTLDGTAREIDPDPTSYNWSKFTTKLLLSLNGYIQNNNINKEDFKIILDDIIGSFGDSIQIEPNESFKNIIKGGDGKNVFIDGLNQELVMLKGKVYDAFAKLAAERKEKLNKFLKKKNN